MFTKYMYSFLDHSKQDLLLQLSFPLEKRQQLLYIKSSLHVYITQLYFFATFKHFKQNLFINGLNIITQSTVFNEKAARVGGIKNKCEKKYFMSRFYDYILNIRSQMENRRVNIEKITCVRQIPIKEYFKEAIKEIYSQRYFEQQRKCFAEAIFIFQIKTDLITWNIFKEKTEILEFLRELSVSGKLSAVVAQQIAKVDKMPLNSQGQLFQEAISEFITSSQQPAYEKFLQINKKAYYSLKMHKLSGGRYKETNCCKIGAIFQGWKERRVDVYLKGIGYYNESNELRQFLSYSQGFYFEYGRPTTGREYGITLYSNHRKLSLQAKNIKDFINFMFVMRKTCEESCYMTLNRFNSYAPIRYSNCSKFFVDGKEYFESMLLSFEAAKTNILITGWMISPQFLLRRGKNKISLQECLLKASHRGVKISIIVYHESCFLPNDSLYIKETMEKMGQNVIVLRHPCGKLPVLWSHHGKLVVIDEQQAYFGGLDLCYGRFDDQNHDLFGSEEDYPGIEYNNIRKNDEFKVREPQRSNIPRNNARLPWHDVGQQIKGKAVQDFVHHFNQLWHFIRYENKRKPHEDCQQSLFENDIKSIFTSKALPEPEQQIEKTFYQELKTRVKAIKTKSQRFYNTVKDKMTKLGEQEKRLVKPKINHIINDNYFEKYVERAKFEIQNKQKSEQDQLLKKMTNKRSNSGRNSRNSSMSKRLSIDEIKSVRKSIEKDLFTNDNGSKKCNSFILTGDKLIDYMNINIDKNYISCLQRFKTTRIKPSGLERESEDKQIESDEEMSELTCNYENENLKNEAGHDQCQVVRSVGNWSIGCHSENTEFSIHIAYLQLISQAKHYIYIENQFFISSVADQSVVKNEVANAIYLRIVRALQQEQNFKVYVVLPLIPGFAGDLQSEECLLLRKEMEWQYDTICRKSTSLWQKLLNHTNNPGKYIQFLGLRNHGRRNMDSSPQTQIIYVHSKLMIIDDELIICGSANINDRSLLGDRDSQIAVVTKGEDFIEGRLNGEQVLVSQLAQELRIKLWIQHFGFEQSQIIDAVDEQVWDKIANRAMNNTSLYRQIFGCYPDDLMTTRAKIKQVSRDKNLKAYESKKDSIIAHVVEFPFNFLCDEVINYTLIEKEFYMPAQCLT